MFNFKHPIGIANKRLCNKEYMEEMILSFQLIKIIIATTTTTTKRTTTTTRATTTTATQSLWIKTKQKTKI
jgi:hypothetical protein